MLALVYARDRLGDGGGKEKLFVYLRFYYVNNSFCSTGLWSDTFILWNSMSSIS